MRKLSHGYLSIFDRFVQNTEFLWKIECVTNMKMMTNTIFFHCVRYNLQLFWACLKLVFAPIWRSKVSQRLISHDIHSNTYNYKSTYSMEIVPVCKVCTYTHTSLRKTWGDPVVTWRKKIWSYRDFKTDLFAANDVGRYVEMYQIMQYDYAPSAQSIGTVETVDWNHLGLTAQNQFVSISVVYQSMLNLHSGFHTCI